MTPFRCMIDAAANDVLIPVSAETVGARRAMSWPRLASLAAARIGSVRATRSRPFDHAAVRRK
jgi:hypothetical protein